MEIEKLYSPLELKFSVTWIKRNILKISEAEEIRLIRLEKLKNIINNT